MDIRKLQRAIVDGLEDVKGQNVVVFNTEHLSPLFERVIIASGTSNRQTKALASSVRDSVRERGFPAPRTEGEGNGEWIIVDCGAAVAHIMQPAIRDYYRLEEIWGDKPVRMKIDGGAAAGAKSAAPKNATSAALAHKEPERKTAAKAAGGSPARKAAPAPAQKPTRAPARTTARAPAAEPARAPARKSTRAPARKSTRATAKKSARAPAKKPARAPRG